MNFEYRHILPPDFSDDSRVWIYQSNRSFNPHEALQIDNMLSAFVSNWKSHGVPVKGFAKLLFNQFIIIMADENATGVSGCSIDSSVHILQQIEQQFNANLMDWQLLAFIADDEVHIISRQQFNHALENNSITPQTLFFNNVVTSKADLQNKWIIPVNESWLKTRIKTVV